MKDILIRHASVKDLEGLVELEQACFTTDMLSKSHFQHLLKAPSAEVLVAVEAKKIIGSLVIFFRKNSKKARLYSLAVHNDYRGRGIAAKLCERMEKSVLTRRCTNLSLEVNTTNHAGIKFYNKHGYDIIGERKKFYMDGTDAFTMQKIFANHKVGAS